MDFMLAFCIILPLRIESTVKSEDRFYNHYSRWKEDAVKCGCRFVMLIFDSSCRWGFGSNRFFCVKTHTGAKAHI